MIKRTAAVAALLLGLAPAAHALEFQPLGGGSIGVGGAGVARNFGAMAPYWNPAGLAFAPKTVTVSITGGAGVKPQGKLAQDLDNLDRAHSAWDADQTNLAKGQVLADAINDLLTTTGRDNLQMTVGAAVGTQIRHVGFGVYGTFEGGALPNPGGIPVPALSASLTQAQVDASLASKTVAVRGILLLEAPLSYGGTLNLGSAGMLGLGASIKYMYGQATSKLSQQVFDPVTNEVVTSSGLTDDLSKNRRGSSDVGIDLGVLWKPTGSTAVGLVAKNLNSPSFATKNGDKITVGRQVRAGVSVDPLSWLELTADIDVFSNSTVIPGLNSQQLGGGAEFHPFSCLKLRAGGYTDLAQSSNGAVTAGLSLGIPWFFFDIDAAYGLGEVKYKNDTYPSEIKAQASLNFAF